MPDHSRTKLSSKLARTGAHDKTCVDSGTDTNVHQPQGRQDLMQFIPIAKARGTSCGYDQTNDAGAFEAHAIQRVKTD